MRNSVIFLGLCVALTAVLAVPATPLQENESVSDVKRQLESLTALTNKSIQSLISFHHLSAMQPRDYFSDLISSTLHMTVKGLLTKIETTFKNLDSVTHEALTRLNELVASASPDMQQKIKAITSDAIAQVFETIMPLLDDLGYVLPVIPNVMTLDSPAADIIWALLNISLEDFVKRIANSMDQLLELLSNTINALRQLANEANPELGSALVGIANNYLSQGRTIIIPMLDQLNLLIDPKRSDIESSVSVLHLPRMDLLNAAVSTMMGVDVHTAAVQTQALLPQLIDVFESTRFELNEVLAISDDDEVQTKVMVLYDKAVDDVIRMTKPIFTTLLQFEGEMRRDRNFPYNMLGSLLGIGLQEFKANLQQVSSRIDATVKETTTNVITSSFAAGIMSGLKVFNIVQRKLIFAERIIRPLLETLKPLLIAKEDKFSPQPQLCSESKECEWANSDGLPYNRDELINAVSKILEVDVAYATKTLKVALENLDALTDVSLRELRLILAGEPRIRSEILGITNETLTAFHISLQPMLDVLLPFLPDQSRSNKEVALDIYAGINGVDVEQFLHYSSLTAKEIPQITENSMLRIKNVAALAGDKILRQVENLLRITDTATKNIVKPFIDIVENIITPLE